MHRPALFLAAAAAAAADPVAPRQATVGQTVQTSSGPVTGFADYNGDVSAYLGIPYAQPPVGNLRWQPPVKFAGDAPIDASAFGDACVGASRLPGDPAPVYPSSLSENGQIIALEELDWAVSQSEDCLTLNVWTEGPPVVADDGGKPVLVFIHGGSFVGGSSAFPTYPGAQFAADEDVVIVTMNYRLGIFGSPGNPTSSANLGLQDQRMAVEWVSENINAFGGDASRIVIFGQSAGSGSVDIMSYAYADDDTVKGFIMESGTATGNGIQKPSTAANVWYDVSAALGCGDAKSDPDAVFECMMGQDPWAINGTSRADNVSTGSATESLYYPVEDGVIVFDDYDTRTPTTRPVLVGQCDKEADLIIYTAGLTSIPDPVWDFVADYLFTCPIAKRTANAVDNGSPVWRYRYYGAFPNTNIAAGGFSGAWHGAELSILFGSTPEDLFANTEAELAIGKYMRGAWAAFAADPVAGLTSYNPDGQGGWPVYDPNGDTLVQIAYNNQTGPNLVKSTQYDGICLVLNSGVGPVLDTVLNLLTKIGSLF